MGRVYEALRRADGAGQRTRRPTGEPESFPWGIDDDDGRTSGEREGSNAICPADEARAAQRMLGHEAQRGLFHGFDPVIELLVASKGASPALVEQFRDLAATLRQTQLLRTLKTLMVTSASVSDGKSITAANLALTLSESYRWQVLLIDADLRRPSQHQVFQVPNVSGLGDGLKAKDDKKLPLIQISERLTLLPGGRPDMDPMGGLASARMSRIIAEAAARFDWVIVDTPPVGVLADARIVSGMVDGVLLVVRAGVTRFHEIEAAVAALESDRILGIVLNAVEPTEIQGKKYYGHYYYGGSPGDERSAG